MRACPSCHGEVAVNAKVCPHCGHRFTTMLAKLFWWLVGVPILIAFAAGILLS